MAKDILELSAAELIKIGEGDGARLNSTLIGTLARVAKLSGITPWQFHGQLDRLWRRAFQGGALGLERVGPTEALIEVRGLPLCRYEYFRYGFAGVITSIANLAAHRAATTVVEHGAESLRMRGTWALIGSRASPCPNPMLSFATPALLGPPGYFASLNAWGCPLRKVWAESWLFPRPPLQAREISV